LAPRRIGDQSFDEKAGSLLNLFNFRPVSRAEAFLDPRVSPFKTDDENYTIEAMMKHRSTWSASIQIQASLAGVEFDKAMDSTRSAAERPF